VYWVDSGGNAVASRSSDFYSETAFERARGEGWLGRARSDGGAPGSGVHRDRCRSGVKEEVEGGTAIGHIGNKHMKESHPEIIACEKRCDDAARALGGDARCTYAQSAKGYPYRLASPPSLTQDCTCLIP
jgi:hypothetical protein